jgi:nucleolar protein 12
MATTHRDPASEAASGDSPAASIRSLFSADNPFRRKASTEEPPATPAPATTPLPMQPSRDARDAEPSSKKNKKSKEEGPRRKRKRDELEAGRERRRGAENPSRVGEKRKAPDDAAQGAGEDEEEAFDDESKLLRTVFVGNLPLRTKRKVLIKEFAAFGEIESVRIRSVPLVDVSTTPLLLCFKFGWKGFSSICCRAFCRPNFRGEEPFYRGRSMDWSTSECSSASESFLFFIYIVLYLFCPILYVA